MTDTPLFDATLSDLLLGARRGVERAEAQAALAARRAAEQAAEARQQARIEVMRAQHIAARTVAEAHARADRAVRQERVRRAFLGEEAEERVRLALVDVPPLPELAGRTISLDGPLEEAEPEAPPVPSMADLLKPSPGVTRFLDTLLGPSAT